MPPLFLCKNLVLKLVYVKMIVYSYRFMRQWRSTNFGVKQTSLFKNVSRTSKKRVLWAINIKVLTYPVLMNGRDI